GKRGRVWRIAIDSRPDLDCPERRWQYDVLELLSQTLPGPRVAGWFGKGRKAATVGSLRFLLPTFLGQVSWRWDSSHSSWDAIPWPTPHITCEIPWQVTGGWSQFGSLVSIDAPGYLDSERAVAEF